MIYKINSDEPAQIYFRPAPSPTTNDTARVAPPPPRRPSAPAGWGELYRILTVNSRRWQIRLTAIVSGKWAAFIAAWEARISTGGGQDKTPVLMSGTHPGGTRAPLGPKKNTWCIFRASSVKLRDLQFWSLFLSFLPCGRTEESCRMINSLRKIDFAHPTGHYIWKKLPPSPF